MIKGITQNGGFSTYLNPGNPGRSWPNVMVEINLAAGAPTAHVPLQAQKGAAVQIRVVDQSGSPISGVVTGGRTARGSYDPGMSSTDGQVTHLRVDEERVVYFIHQDRKLGKVIKVRPGDDAKGPLVVTLEPLASVMGRITDEEGMPYAEAVVRLDFLFSDKTTRTLTTVFSASDGRFNLTDVPVGVEYVLGIQGKPSSANSQRSASHEQTAVKPGETTDVGDISIQGIGIQESREESRTDSFTAGHLTVAAA